MHASAMTSDCEYTTSIFPYVAARLRALIFDAIDCLTFRALDKLEDLFCDELRLSSQEDMAYHHG